MKTTNTPKPARGLGRAISSQRAAIKREILRTQEEERKKRNQQALEEMGRWQRTPDPVTVEARKRIERANSLLQFVTSNQTAVIRSYGLRQRVNANVTSWSSPTEAWTDFSSITLQWNPSTMEHSVPTAVVELRGILQHELGHLLHTIPPRRLQNHRSWREVIERRYTTEPPIHLLHRMINVLEDQRMESRMVRDVPRLSSCFTVIVARAVLAGMVENPGAMAWTLVAGRQYLPSTFLSKTASAFDAKYGSGAHIEWANIVAAYKSAKSVKALIEAACDAYDWAEAHGLIVISTTEHGNPWGGPNEEQMEETAANGAVEQPHQPTPPNPTSTPAGDPVEEGTQGDEDSDEDSDETSTTGQGEQEAESDSESAQEGSEGDPSDDAAVDDGEGVGTGGNDEHDATTDEIKQMLDEIEKEATATAAADDDVVEILDCWNPDGPVLDFSDRYVTHERWDSVEENGNRIAAEVEQALQQWVTAAAPVWHGRQERGIVDPIAYTSRTPGDRAFFRNRSGDGEQTLDLHLSLLCDNSGSMTHHMQALSAVMYGMATACDRLGIGRSMMLWSDPTSTTAVWSNSTPTPSLFGAVGGTEPSTALNDLENHNVDGRSRHLVVIFTDGEWGAFGTLQQWAAEGRTIMLIKFRPDRHFTYGADHVVEIHSMLDMPVQISASLNDILATLY